MYLKTNYLFVLALVITSAAYSETDVANSWQQVAGNHDFESTNTYCKQMDSLATAKSAQSLSDLLVGLAYTQRGNGPYAAQRQLAEMNGFQAGINSRPPSPSGMPFMECMNSLGWVFHK